VDQAELNIFLLNLPTVLAIDIETMGLDRDSELVSAAIAWEGKTASFWLDRFFNRSDSDIGIFKKIVDVTLFNPGFAGTVVFHNVDFDIKFLLERFFAGPKFSSDSLCGIMDTLTISRISRNNKYVSHADPRQLKCHSLKYLAKEHLEISHSTFEDVVGYSNIRFAPRNDVLTYNGADAAITLKLYNFFLKNISTEEMIYVKEIEIPHLLNLIHMNWHGVPYDLEAATKFLGDAQEILAKIETDIFKSIGRTFNIASQAELSSAIFHNERLTYKASSREQTTIAPLYLTSSDQIKVDLDTLIEIKKRIHELDAVSPAIVTLNKIVQYNELSKSLNFIEQHLSFAKKTADGYRIYPNFSAEAKSGRVKSSRPNMLGLPKRVFKKSNTEDLPLWLKDSSVRQFIGVLDGHQVESIDISALDLSIVTLGAKHFNPDFMWRTFFESDKGLDIHLAVAQKVSADRLRNALDGLDNVPADLDSYWMKKPSKEGVTFIHKSSGQELKATYKQNDLDAVTRMSRTRAVAKVLNLSVSYMIGAVSLAMNIRKNAGEDISAEEAQNLLDNFYEKFPEIRSFQNEVSNKVYGCGYVQSIFGRRYYAEVFDELNENYNNGNGIYEFVCLINSKYWYIKAEGWEKDQIPVIEDMKPIVKPFGLRFRNILEFTELDRHIFRKSDRSQKKSKFNRKSEENQDEMSKYELSRMSLTNEIDRFLSFGQSFSAEATALMESFIYAGDYKIPEKNIMLFRAKIKNPSSQYFRFYKSFIKVTREFFPMYCQGVANSVASICLTNVRKEIEKKNLNAQILLFVHDQMDVLVEISQGADVKALLAQSIEQDKKPFDVPLHGEHKSGKSIPA